MSGVYDEYPGLARMIRGDMEDGDGQPITEAQHALAEITQLRMDVDAARGRGSSLGAVRDIASGTGHWVGVVIGRDEHGFAKRVELVPDDQVWEVRVHGRLVGYATQRAIYDPADIVSFERGRSQ